jgi:hypothetical protein
LQFFQTLVIVTAFATKIGTGVIERILNSSTCSPPMGVEEIGAV